MGPLLEEVRSGHLATSDGLSYLEAKHLLLLNYCINITFYLMMKAEGRSVKDHPVIARLVQVGGWGLMQQWHAYCVLPIVIARLVQVARAAVVCPPVCRQQPVPQQHDFM